MSERDMTRLIALLERQLGVQWVDVVEWLRGQNAVADLEAKLVSGRMDDVIADVTTAAQKFASEIHNAYLTSGQRSAQWLDAKLPDTLVRFDAAHPLVVARARQNTLQQVYGLTTETRVNVHTAIVEGQAAGTNPRVWAQRIKDSIGLHPVQERAMNNYRGYLEAGDWSKAMTYELRDGRADRSMRPGMQLSQKRVDELVEQYRKNATVHRAQTIARTEGLANAHDGVNDAIDQAISRGDLTASQLEDTWHSGPPTKHARPDHQKMNEKTVPYGQDFVLPDGTRMRGPGDRRGGAKHCVGCRCCKSTAFAVA